MADNKAAKPSQEKAPTKEVKPEAKSENSPAGGQPVSDSISPKLDKIISQIETLTILELADLVKALEDKFGVSAAAPVAVAAAPATAAAPAAEAEEKSEYDVVLKAVGDKKISVIKALREINQNLGLIEAKTLAESAPKPVLEGAKKEDAEAAKKKLEDAGATVELK